MRALVIAMGLLLAGCHSSSSGGGVVVTPVTATIDAGTVAGTLQPVWGDHYDLSFTHLNYTGETGFTSLFQSLSPRTVRCSVGRWEIGLTSPANANSANTTLLAQVDREFYRGGNNLTDAADSTKYDFTWLDAQLAAITSTGVVPFLCFDYTPFTLSSEQNPSNANNLFTTNSAWSYANGIRTAPPASNAVYARVVRNTIRHVRGLFAGTTNYGVTHVEIGNEPDLVDATGARLKIFYTGTSSQWIATYNAIAAEVGGDASLNSVIKLGGGSFAFQTTEGSPSFLSAFLSDVAANTTRCDFVSFHSYGDDPTVHWDACNRATQVRSALALTMPLINAEWGRALNGDDPVYDTIAHGLFRAKVMILFQLFGVQYGHEALLRDVFPTGANLGLLKTGPASPKPAADVYAALARFNPALNALPVNATTGQYVMAGRSAASDRVVVAWMGDAPGVGAATRLDLTIDNLPWGSAAFSARRYVVSDATNAAGQGVALQETVSGSGGTFTASVTTSAGAGQLVLWELTSP